LTILSSIKKGLPESYAAMATFEEEESTSMVRGVLESMATPRYRRLLVSSRIN